MYLPHRLWSYLVEHPAPPTDEASVFDRFCIFFLSADWIFFGSLHFFGHTQTRDMIPPGVPLPDAIVVVTGVAEVAAGFFMLYRRPRRVAALSSLILLALLLVAVLYILVSDSALPFKSESLLNSVFRLLVVPNVVVMAIFSMHLLRKPFPDASPPLPLG